MACFVSSTVSIAAVFNDIIHVVVHEWSALAVYIAISFSGLITLYAAHNFPNVLASYTPTII